MAQEKSSTPGEGRPRRRTTKRVTRVRMERPVEPVAATVEPARATVEPARATVEPAAATAEPVAAVEAPPVDVALEDPGVDDDEFMKSMLARRRRGGFFAGVGVGAFGMGGVILLASALGSTQREPPAPAPVPVAVSAPTPARPPAPAAPPADDDDKPLRPSRQR